jgi:hypothetical protein
MNPAGDPYSELIAGYALDALEPEDEARLEEHLRGCASCNLELTRLRNVSARLADLSVAAEPPPGLGAAIRAAALADSGEPGREPLGGFVVAQLQRHRAARAARSRRWLAAAASLLLLGAGLGIGLGLRGGGRQSVAGACTPSAGCHRVTLLAASDHRQAALVLVRGTSVTLVPEHLAPDHRNSQIYVLWQVTGAHTPLAIGSFDVGPGRATAVEVGQLPAPYADSWAFAVSLESGRTIPPAPSQPVALGTVSS